MSEGITVNITHHPSGYDAWMLNNDGELKAFVTFVTWMIIMIVFMFSW